MKVASGLSPITIATLKVIANRDRAAEFASVPFELTPDDGFSPPSCLTPAQIDAADTILGLRAKLDYGAEYSLVGAIATSEYSIIPGTAHAKPGSVVRMVEGIFVSSKMFGWPVSMRKVLMSIGVVLLATSGHDEMTGGDPFICCRVAPRDGMTKQVLEELGATKIAAPWGFIDTSDRIDPTSPGDEFHFFDDNALQRAAHCVAGLLISDNRLERAYRIFSDRKADHQEQLQIDFAAGIRHLREEVEMIADKRLILGLSLPMFAGYYERQIASGISHAASP